MHAKTRNWQLALAIFLVFGLGLSPAQAAAKSKKRKAQPPCAAEGTCAIGKPGLRGSQESKAERSKRLKRECKGRPNSGACLGYAY